MGQFRPTPADSRSLGQLLDELRRVERLAADEAAAAAPAPRQVAAERRAAQRAVDARPAGAAPARRQVGAPLGAKAGAPAGASPPGDSIAPVAVQCEDCGAEHVLRAERKGRPPAHPAGNWFCAECTAEARRCGIRLFDRVVDERQAAGADGRGRREFRVRYWGLGEGADGWLSLKEMQRLEVSCRGN